MPRENLRTISIPDLSTLHQPLSRSTNIEQREPEPIEKIESEPGQGTGEPFEGRKPPARSSISKVVEMYPSLGAPPREHMIPFTARIPLSMINELTKVCQGRDKSPLVRDFIAAGLATLRAPRDKEETG
jgi:hypothetical protein